MTSNQRGSTGTTVVFLLLGIVLGAALGYWYASRTVERPVPRVREVRFELKDQQLVEEHLPLYLTAERGDKIVWRSDSVPNFTVRVSPLSREYQEQWHAACAEGTGPENPFQSPTPVWQGEKGRAESGAAKAEAKGHCYKYSITTPDGKLTLDPHIIFDTGG